MLKIPYVAGLLLLAFLTTGLSAAAWATQYPLTITDLAGRQVTIPSEPKRIALQDGRDILMVALLDRSDPFSRLVIWNNIISRQDGPSWRLLSGRWPKAKAVPDMGFGDDGQVNTEDMLAGRPQLVIAQRRALGSFVAAGVDKRLAELNIPLIFVDLFDAPVPNAVNSVNLLGNVLNREHEAADYAGFYDGHLKHLQDAIATMKDHPRVFVEPLAGRQGPEQCCFTHGKIGWGLLVEAIGAKNIGSELLSTATGNVTLETVLAAKPDVYVMSGESTGKPGVAMAPLGYDTDPAKVQAALAVLESRPGFAGLEAAKTGRVFGIWHQFYNHPYNIVALEWLSKFAYPKEFASLDPDETYKAIISRFTQIPAEPFFHAVQAPQLRN
jgi:iron complex transport system substrate-binding protein